MNRAIVGVVGALVLMPRATSALEEPRAPGSPPSGDAEPIVLPPVEVRATALLVPPTYRTTPVPPYPAAAREQRIEGTALLSVQVRSDGRVGEARVKTSSGSSLLDDVAVAAVRRWTFEPARRRARAVETWVEVPVRFSLR